MGGKVPIENMTRPRQELLAEAANYLQDHSTNRPSPGVLVSRLFLAAQECPRAECATCEHLARSEAQKQVQTGSP